VHTGSGKEKKYHFFGGGGVDSRPVSFLGTILYAISTCYIRIGWCVDFNTFFKSSDKQVDVWCIYK
jgi:hypothetical protein